MTFDSGNDWSLNSYLQIPNCESDIHYSLRKSTKLTSSVRGDFKSAIQSICHVQERFTC